jgi:hypothetical protein
MELTRNIWSIVFQKTKRLDKIINTSVFLDFLSGLDPYVRIAKTTGHNHGLVHPVHDTHLHELGSHLRIAMEDLTVVPPFQISRTGQNWEAPFYVFHVPL